MVLSSAQRCTCGIINTSRLAYTHQNQYFVTNKRLLEIGKIETNIEKIENNIPVYELDSQRPWYTDNKHEDMGFLSPSFVHIFAIGIHQ